MDRARHQDGISGDIAQRPSTMRAGVIWRVRGVPASFDAAKLKNFLQDHTDLQVAVVANQADSVEGRIGVEVRTLAADLRRDQVATVRFSSVPTPLALLEQNGQLLIAPPESTEGAVERGLARRTISIDRHFHHITVLFAPPADKHEVDVLAVCGLGAHAFGSFVHKASGHMWLGDSLPEDMPTTRVMIYGYDSGLQRSSSFASLGDFAISVRNAMCQVMRLSRKHLILIGHSLGGLLIKEALVKLADSGPDSDLLNLVVGALFFGVPNDGMNVESLFPLVKDQPNQFLLHSLYYINSQASTHQSRIFAELLQRSNFELYCFYETELSRTAVMDANGHYKMTGTPSCLVTRNSATGCLPLDVSSDYSVPINRTHSDLVKFSPYDAGYDTVVDKIHQIHQSFQAKLQITPAYVAHNLTLKYKKTKEIDHQSFEQHTIALDTDHAVTLRDMNKIANALYGQGCYKATEEIYRETLAVQERVLGIEHPDTLKSMSNLGTALAGQGQYKTAEGMHRKTLALQRRVLGEEHPDTLKSIGNVGATLACQGQYKAAEEMHRETLALQKKVLGREHSDTLKSMGNLGTALACQGQYKAAERMHQETLAIRRRVLGEEHSDTLESMSNLGIALASQDQYKAAEGMYRETLALQRRVLGEEHSDTLESMSNLGTALACQGQYKAAEETYRETLIVRKRALGEEHPDTFKSMSNVGFALACQGQYKAAEMIHHETLIVRKRVLGEEHPNTLQSRYDLGNALYKQGQYKSAEGMYRETLTIERRLLGEEHLDTLQSMSNIGKALYKQGQYKAAEGVHQETLAIRRRVLGDEHPNTIESMSNLEKVQKRIVETGRRK